MSRSLKITSFTVLALLALFMSLSWVMVAAQESTSSSDAAMLEANKAIAERFYELFNANELDQLSENVAADVIDHNPFPGQPEGLEGVQWALGFFRTVFPDIEVTIDSVVAEGDLVVLRLTATGSQQAELLGIPATGKAVTFGAFDMYRIEEGKIVEIWHLEDLLGVTLQLAPPPAP